MAPYDFDRDLYLPIWHLLRRLLVVWSMTDPDSPAGERTRR
jgi:hypothetical protein